MNHELKTSVTKRSGLKNRAMTQLSRMVSFSVCVSVSLLFQEHAAAQVTTVSLNPPLGLAETHDDLTSSYVIQAKGSASGDCNAVTSDAPHAHAEALACDVSGVTASNSSRFGDAVAETIVPFTVEAAGGSCIAGDCVLDIELAASAQAQSPGPSDYFGGAAYWTVVVGTTAFPTILSVDPISGAYVFVQQLGGVGGGSPFGDKLNPLHLWEGFEESDNNGGFFSEFQEWDYTANVSEIASGQAEFAGLGDRSIKRKLVLTAGTQYFLGLEAHASLGSNAPGLAIVDPVLTVDPSNPAAVLHINAPLSNGRSILSAEGAAALAAAGFDLNRLANVGITVSANKPTITTTAAATPGPNSYGWNNTGVSIALNASESNGPGVQAINFSLSGAETGTGIIPGASGSVPVTAEGITTLTYFAQDTIGNKESPKLLTVQIDKTPPTLSPVLSPMPNTNGWNNTNVTVQFTASDSLSGVATVSSPVTLSNEGKGQVVVGTATDRAGNTANFNVTVNIDRTPPVISGLPMSGCLLWPPNHQLVQIANVSARDALSGVAPGSFLVTGASNEAANAGGSGNTAPDILIDGGDVEVRAERSGSGNGRMYTVDATATDLAGNVAIASGDCVVPHDQGKGN